MLIDLNEERNETWGSVNQRRWGTVPRETRGGKRQDSTAAKKSRKQTFSESPNSPF